MVGLPEGLHLEVIDVFISIRLSPQKTVSKESTARMCWEIMINTPDALQLAHHLCILQ